MGRRSANEARVFFTMPTRASQDSRLSALDYRVLGRVSLHDGMSLVKGKGSGCYASNQTLAAAIGCDYTSLSKAITRLIDFGYLIRSRSTGDKRMKVLQVVFDAEDSWRNDQLSGSELVGEQANQAPEIVGERNSETRRNLPKTDAHYIPLKVELDSVETVEIDSPKVRIANATRAAFSKKLHRDGEPIHETIAKFERNFRADWTAYIGKLSEWSEWLYSVAEEAAGDDVPMSSRAMRLYELVEDFRQYEPDA